MKKLKQQYQNASYELFWTGRFYWNYPNLRNRYFRYFSTYQEQAFDSLHRCEYANYPIRYRARRGKNLPTSWHDITSYSHKYAKSWKHNSKRQHQWYREKEVA